MKIPSRLHRQNPALIAASNALHCYLVFDLTPYKGKGFVKKVQKNKAIYQSPKRVDSFK